MPTRQYLDRRAVLALLTASAAGACAPGAPLGSAVPRLSSMRRRQIDRLLDDARVAYGTVGYSVAILRSGSLVYERHAGLADRETATSVSDRSLYPLYSVSKLFLIVALAGAVEPGEIDPEMPISRIRAGLPAAWWAITLRQALGHMSGLPDYIPDHIAQSADAAFEAISGLPLRFPPGSRNDYNQTNFLLAREALEQATGRSLIDLTTAQFARAGMRQTRYPIGAQRVEGLVKSYRPAPDRRAPAVYREAPRWPSYTFGSSGAVANLQDLVSWSGALLRGDLLPLSALHRSWRPQFLNSSSGARAWHTNGWNYDAHDDVVIVGHAGDNRVVWRHVFRAGDPQDNATIIYLDNGGRIPLMPARIASLLAEQVMPGAARPSEPLAETLFQRLASHRWDEAAALVDRQARTLDDGAVQMAVNQVGYDALYALGAQDALLPFRLNVARFPSSSNAHDSLGEAYRVSGDLAAARASYSRALELDPGNARISGILAEIDAQGPARP